MGLQLQEKLGQGKAKHSPLQFRYNILIKGEQNSAIFHLKKAITIYTEIFGKNHSHTISAISSLVRAEKYPDANKNTKMRPK